MPRSVHTPETREADRAYRRKWYAANAEHAKGKVVERRRALRDWFRAHRETLKCERCPESDPDCLDFHHLDPKEKETNVATACRAGWSIPHLQAEMAKCIVLCANCHRKHHAGLAQWQSAAL